MSNNNIEDDDDCNPMQFVGYGRGDDVESWDNLRGKVGPGPMKTNVSPLAKTEQMPAVAPPLNVKMIVSGLIEKDLEAWKKLPYNVQDLMLSSPEKFRFHEFNGAAAGMGLSPDIIYNGVRFRYEDGSWRLYDIEIK